MIRKRIAMLDDDAIYGLVMTELVPYSNNVLPGIVIDGQMIKRQLDRNRTFVAVTGLLNVFGFVSCRVEGAVLYIDMLALDGKMQHRGWGKRLMEVARSYGKRRGCRIVRLYVDDTNVRAIAFYSKLGFAISSYYPSFRCYSMRKWC